MNARISSRAGGVFPYTGSRRRQQKSRIPLHGPAVARYGGPLSPTPHCCSAVWRNRPGAQVSLPGGVFPYTGSRRQPVQSRIPLHGAGCCDVSGCGCAARSAVAGAASANSPTPVPSVACALWGCCSLGLVASTNPPSRRMSCSDLQAAGAVAGVPAQVVFPYTPPATFAESATTAF